MPTLFQQLKLISTHTTISDEERRIYAKITVQTMLDFFKHDFTAAIQVLRNVYQKGWPVYHELTDYILDIHDYHYRAIVTDILGHTLKAADIASHIRIDQLSRYTFFGLLPEAAYSVGPTVICHLLEQKQSDVLLSVLQSGPIEFNLNALIFNDFCVYLMANEAIFAGVRQLAAYTKNYRLYGICELLLFQNSGENIIKQRTISSNGLLCCEYDFYQRYLQISKYWEDYFDYEPVVEPSIVFADEVNYEQFHGTYEYLSATYQAGVASEFIIFLGQLQDKLENLLPLDFNDAYLTVTEYTIVLQHYKFEQQLLEAIAQIVLFLIEEAYQQNEQEIRFREQEKQYEVIYLLQSQYYFYDSAKEQLIIPDYYEVMSTRGNTQEPLSHERILNQNVGLLNGETLSLQRDNHSRQRSGFTPVENRSSHPNQLFKIPANTEYLRLLAAFAKLIVINDHGMELLDQINLSVSMLRFLIIAIFYNETYNVKPRSVKQNTPIYYDKQITQPKFISYPTACCSAIYNRLNSVLYVSQTYPLVLQNFKSMQTPYPRVSQYNISRITQSSPYYQLQGLYEAPALSIYQFCFPMQKKLYFYNIFGIFKSSPSLNIFIFRPSLSIFLYNVVNQIPDSLANEHSRMIVDTVIYGLQAHPFLCKHESILLCLSSFLLVFDQMISKKISSLKVLRFINIFLSTVPLLELALLLENLNTALHTQLSAVYMRIPLVVDENDQITDEQFGNQYHVLETQIPCVTALHSYFVTAIEMYAREILLNPMSFDVNILTNTLLMFRHQENKKYIAGVLDIAGQVFQKLVPTYSQYDKELLISQRKYQLINYLQAVQVFYDYYKIADPRVFNFDKLCFFLAEIRNFYYYQRIFKAQDHHLLRCFQSQVRHLHIQFQYFYLGASKNHLADDEYDRFASALRINGVMPAGALEDCLVYTFLEKNGYFTK